MAMKPEDQAWLLKVGQDPEFQRLYQAAENARVRPGETPQQAQQRVGPQTVDPRYALNQYLNKIGMPKGRALDMSGGQLALKDRASAWTIPLAAVAAAGTLGIAAFAPAVIGLAGSGGGSAAAGGGGTAAATGGTAAATGVGAGTAATTAGGTVGTLGTIANAAKKGYDAYNKYSDVISNIGEVAGGMSEGRAQGRLQEYLAQLEGERGDIARAGQAKEFEGTDQRRMLINDLLSRMENVNINAPFLLPTSRTGGLGASGLSAEARAALTKAAGSYRDVMPGGTAGRGVVASPTARPMPQAGGMDKLLNVLSGVGSFGAMLPKPYQRPAGNPNTLNTTYRPPAPAGSFNFG
jgi:hypothetical protein